MTMVTHIVEFHVKAEHRAEFGRRVRAHAAGTLREEEGCLRFDVMEPRDEPNTIWLFEVYRDEAAREHHIATERLKNFRAWYAEDILESRNIVVADMVEAEVPPKA